MKLVINGESIVIPSGSSGSASDSSTSQDVYSTEETRIGTWIDGKPLYRRVYSLTTPSGIDAVNVNVWFYLPDNISLVRYEGWVELSSNQGYRPLNSPQPTESYTIAFYNFMNYMLIQCNTAIKTYLENRPAIAILEYTKTTD